MNYITIRKVIKALFLFIMIGAFIGVSHIYLFSEDIVESDY